MLRFIFYLNLSIGIYQSVISLIISGVADFIFYIIICGSLPTGVVYKTLISQNLTLSNFTNSQPGADSSSALSTFFSTFNLWLKANPSGCPHILAVHWLKANPSGCSHILAMQNLKGSLYGGNMGVYGNDHTKYCRT